MSPSHAPDDAVGQRLFFGKLPSRGDFIRSTDHADVVADIDRWQSRALERLSTDPRWKLVYDRAPDLPFAIVGTGSQRALAGHWQASRDSAGRRFPFVTAALFDWPRPREVVALAPLMLAEAWAALSDAGRCAHGAHAHGDAQACLLGVRPLAASPEVARATLLDFMDTHTVSSLSQMLTASGHRMCLRQSVLAVGLLLSPALTQGGHRLGRVLRLPVVAEPGMRWSVASWWLVLVLAFFQRHDVELALFLDTRRGPPHLLLGFQGASAATLEAVIDPDTPGREGVGVVDAEWVEAEVVADPGLRKLSTYLSDPDLSLWQVMRTCQEVFLGA